MLISNLATTCIRELLHGLERFESRPGEAIAILGFLIGLSSLIFVPAVWETVLFFYPRVTDRLPGCIRYEDTNENKRKCLAFLVITWVQTITISFFYYIGDNLGPSLKEFGKFIGCYKDCVDRSQVASLIFLSIASVSVYLINFLIKHIFPLCSIEIPKDKSVGYKLTQMLVEAVKLDLLYSTFIKIGIANEVLNSQKPESFCTPTSILYGMVILVGCYLIGFIVEMLICVKVFYVEVPPDQEGDWPDWPKGCVFLSCLLFASIVTLILYIMADNHLPLEFNLCSYNFNSTEYILKKQEISLVRFTLGGVCLSIVIVFSIIVCWIFYGCNRCVNQDSEV